MSSEVLNLDLGGSNECSLSFDSSSAEELDSFEKST